MKKIKSLRAAMLADMQRSGIEEKHLKQLQFAPRDIIATRKELGLRWRCEATTYQIPYFDPAGKRTNFARYRLLDGSWNNTDPKGGSYRYNQKLGTLPHLYFPPVIEWPINEDKKIQLPYLCITEGEKKAIKACLTDIPTVALGGVYSFAAKKKQINLLEEFSLFDFSETQIEICFDSDVHSNDQVRAAMNKLASELTPLTNKPIRYVMLDGESTDKKGLDDFLHSFKTAEKAEIAFWALPRQEDRRSAAVVDFNQQLVFVRNNSRYFNTEHRRWYLRKEDICNEFENMPKVPHPDKPDMRVEPVKIWFQHRKPETTVQEIVYEPGKEPRYPGKHSDVINVWRPSSIKPHEGSPKPWLRLYDFLTQGLSATERKWFMQWLAYPLQHPGAKLHQAIFISSHSQGIGKNLLIEPFIQNIYGDENYSGIGGDVLEEIYNSWITRKQFVFVDEAHVGSKAERIKAMNRLNRYVTEHQTNVREMYTPRHVLKNCANMYISSNHSDGLMISDKDRRFFVIAGPETALADEEYAEMVKFSISKKGIGQVLNHLLTVDLTGYNPHAHAPKTLAKARSVETSQDAISYYVALLKNSPADLFSMNGIRPDKELFSTSEICAAINTHSTKMGSKFWTTPNSIGKYLSNGRVVSSRVQYREKEQVGRVTLYAVFNPDKWEKKEPYQWLTHMRKNDPRFAKTEVRTQLELRLANGKDSEHA